MRRRLIWWLFDRSPERFQRWAESWARTLVVRSFRRNPRVVVWSTSTASTIPGAKFTYKTETGATP